MTLQEYEDLKNENKVSRLYVNTGDQVKDLMVEIYFEGFCEGYERAVYYLQEIGPSIRGCDYNTFFERHLNKIKARLDAIRQIDGDNGEFNVCFGLTQEEHRKNTREIDTLWTFVLIYTFC